MLATLRLGAISLAFIVVCFAPGAAMADEEIPDYKVLREVSSTIEIRRYPPMLLAEVDVEGERQEAVGKAFRVLAGFIFGGNTSQESVAMTAPVTMEPNASKGEEIAMTAPVTMEGTEQNVGVVGDGVWTVAFMMPSQYTRDTLPTPNNKTIRIRESDPYDAIAIKFTGRYTNSNMSGRLEELDAAVESEGVQKIGPPIVAFYNGPFTPFFLRRNEIMYRIEMISDSAS